MAKVVTGILKTPKNADGERYVVHPETDSSQVLVDNVGTTLKAKLNNIDTVLSVVDPDGDIATIYATDDEVEECLDDTFGED